MKTRIPPWARALLAAALLPVDGGALQADAGVEAEIRDLRAKVERLSQRLQELEKRERRQDGRPVPAAPRVSADDRGFALTSADDANSLRFDGLVQLDSRTFFGGGAGTGADSFVLRRARIIATGRLSGIYGFQIVPEFGGGAVSLLDANLTVAPVGRFGIKVGRFKAPVGLEQLQSDTVTFFVERSPVSGLVPNRDLGIQFGGGSAAGEVDWAVGVFNGVADGASTTNADFDNGREVMGRVFVRPFAGDRLSPLRKSGFGLAGSYGRRNGAAGVSSGFKTDGQQTWFRYANGVLADGTAWRLSPQAYAAAGPFSALGEYVVSAFEARPAAASPKTALRNRAWQLGAGWVLTGEDAAYSGITPRRPFSWTDGRWGAWQLVLRHARLTLDERTFPAFAATTAHARGTATTAFGVNWYLSRAVRTSLDYFHTRFEPLPEGAFTSVAPEDEDVIISRFQLSF